jgi:hypothetical protein
VLLRNMAPITWLPITQTRRSFPGLVPMYCCKIRLWERSSPETSWVTAEHNTVAIRANQQLDDTGNANLLGDQMGIDWKTHQHGAWD